MNDLVGQNLGPYRIIEELGAGGMAKVYKARQPSMNRDVAIKVLPGYFASDPTFFGRFRQEATLIANLEHARILPVYDSGEQDGIAYIVMRYLTGGSLNELIQKKPLPLDQVARIIGQVAEGLDYAHKHGVIHRDIKPANIMFDDEGDAYIADFGIAKLAEGTAQFTGSGVIGTPAYISPEQGLGNSATPRSDVYSLGVVLYQIVIGEVPYYAETPLAVVIKHINEPLPLPSAINPNIPQAVEQVIIRALAKDPEQRFASCGEMAQALQEAVGVAKGRPIAPDATDLSTPTELMHARTDPMLPKVSTSAPPPVAGETAHPADASQSQPMPVQNQRPGWLLPMAIGAILVLLVIVAGLLILILTDNPILAFLDDDDVTGPPPIVESGPGSNPGAASPLPGQIPQAQSICPPEDTPILVTDFIAAAPAQFEGKGELITLEGGSKVLEISATSDNPVRLDFDENVTNGTVVVAASFPEGPATIALASRVNQAGDYYAAVYNSSDEVSISRSGESQVDPQSAPVSLFDGQPHRLMLNTIGERVQFLVDDTVVLEWRDDEALSAGGFAFEVLEGVVRLEAVAICEGSGNAQPPASSDQAPLFEDDFNGENVKDVWSWIDEPDGWNLDGDSLIIPVLPGTGLIQNAGLNPLNLPALIMNLPETPNYSIQVDVQVAPEQDFQGAGLIVLTDRLQEPLYSLMRMSCAPESETGCKGDAVYFQRWGLIGDAQAAERMKVGGAGELPADGSISLMLHINMQRNEIGAWYSLDGQNWVQVGGGPLVGQRVGPVGVITSTGGQPTGEAIPAQFDNFVITTDG